MGNWYGNLVLPDTPVSPADVRKAAHALAGRSHRVAVPPASVMAPPSNGMLRSYTPSLGERITGYIADRLQGAGMDPRQSYRLGEKLFGALDAVTPLGNMTMAADAGTEFRNGHPLMGAGLGALAILPGAAGKGARKAGGMFGRALKFDDLHPEVKEDIVHHIAALANDDPQFVGQTLSGLVDPLAVPGLRLAPAEIASLKATSPNAVAKYAQMPATGAPPVMVERTGNGWRLLEGGHRHAAALQRGDKAINAVDVTHFRKANWPGFFDGETDHTMPLWSNISRGQ